MGQRNLRLFGAWLVVVLLATQTVALSYTFGGMHKYSSYLYDELVLVPAKEAASNSYILQFRETPVDDWTECIITGIHAFDNEEGAAEVLILDGGIGSNYTTLLFVNNSTAAPNSINFKLSIFGVAV